MAAAPTTLPAPPNKKRAPFKAWSTLAPKVRELAERGWNISDAVRRVVSDEGYGKDKRAFPGVRAAYYVLIGAKGGAGGRGVGAAARKGPDPARRPRGAGAAPAAPAKKVKPAKALAPQAEWDFEL